MKLNRTLVLCLTIALAAALAIGSTTAYLTSTAGNRNVMTVGNVKIEQYEYQRDEDGTIVHFKDGENKLIPGYFDDPSTDGTVTIDGKEYPIYDQTVQGEVDKIVTVKNMDDSEPVYVRTIVAYEHTDPNGDGDFSDGIAEDLHAYYNENGWTLTTDPALDHIVIGDNYWRLVVLTYETELAVGATTEPSLMQVCLDKSVNSDELALVNGEYEILVLSQAVQAQMGDLTPAEALDTAFGAVTEANAREWLSALLPIPDVEEGGSED